MSLHGCDPGNISEHLAIFVYFLGAEVNCELSQTQSQATSQGQAETVTDMHQVAPAEFGRLVLQRPSPEQPLPSLHPAILPFSHSITTPLCIFCIAGSAVL